MRFFKKVFYRFKNFIFGGGEGASAPKIEVSRFDSNTKDFFMLENNVFGFDFYHNENVPHAFLERSKQSSFVYLKCTEGVKFFDPTFKGRKEILDRNKVPCGGYHYYRSKYDPVEQAEFFCKMLGAIGAYDLPPVLDIEQVDNTSIEQLIIDLKKFLEKVEELTDKIPVFYSYYSFIKMLNLDSSFSRYPLWLAKYTHDFKDVVAPAPWKNWTIIQYTEEFGSQYDHNFFKRS